MFTELFQGVCGEPFTDDHDEFLHLVNWWMGSASDDHFQKTGARGLCGKYYREGERRVSTTGSERGESVLQRVREESQYYRE